MQLFYNYHNNKLYNFLHSDILLFDLSVWTHTFSRSLIAIFIPILLLQMGYGIGDVVLYYFLFNLFDVPLNFFAQSLIARVGAKIAIIIGSLFSVGFFAILFNLTVDNWPLLIVMALFAAFYDTLYWVAHLFIFYKYNRKNTGEAAKNTSRLSMVRSFAGISAPILGAVVLIYLGSKALIVVSILILIISIWILFKIRTVKDFPEVKPVPFREFFAEKGVFKKYLARGLSAINSSAEGIIWPMFIFLVFDSISAVAYLPAIASVTTMILTYYTGRLAKRNKKKLIIIGGVALSLVWVLRIFIEVQVFYFVSVFLIGLFSVLVTIPIESSITELVRKKDPLSVATYRNISSMSVNLFFFGILAVLINVFQVSFILAAGSCLVIVLLISSINSRYI